MPRPFPFRAAAALPAAIALTACMATGAHEAGGFDGDYRLVSIDGGALPGSASMTIAGDAVSGTGPCNEYRARNTVAWPQVALGPIATTRRACLSEGGESVFLAALRQVSRIEAVSGGIELSGPSNRLRLSAGH